MRETGFYWIKEDDEWEVGYWLHSYWSLAGSEKLWDDEDFSEIDEARIVRLNVNPTQSACF